MPFVELNLFLEVLLNSVNILGHFAYFIMQVTALREHDKFIKVGHLI